MARAAHPLAQLWDAHSRIDDEPIRRPRLKFALEAVAGLAKIVGDSTQTQTNLGDGPHQLVAFPTDTSDQLLADLQAQAAANRLGVQELGRLIERHGLDEVRAYMAHGQAHGAGVHLHTSERWLQESMSSKPRRSAVAASRPTTDSI
jgi:hypothetical protein